jgi:predicted O-methyltransferase YrrM
MTGDERWEDVDRYLRELFAPADLRDSEAAGLPSIQVTPTQGKLLHLLARATEARRILELGTLGGYSAIWLARALPPDGALITLEADPRHAEVARANLDRAGVSGLVEIRVGPALETLPQLVGTGPFDLIFIDADKVGYPDYFGWSLRLAGAGSVIVADNVVRGGAVADPDSEDPNVLAVRRFHELVAAEPRVSATVIQTVGTKGYDGFTLALVTEPG